MGNRSRVRLAAGLWVVWAVVVWNVTFDWETRDVARTFASEQLERRAHRLPPISLNDGFRPRVRTAAVRSTAWTGALVAIGIGAFALAARSRSTTSSPTGPG